MFALRKLAQNAVTRSAVAPQRGLATAANAYSQYPENVGVIAADIYFPSRHVSQKSLESFDGVSSGKYEVGLEQTNMAFVDDREDIYSMSLTAAQNLLEKFDIDPKDIGRLEVGTETVLDKSKSIKSVLMSLFEPHGNHNIEGIDTINACYGGTAALHNAVNWVESSSWDGRYAMVVTGDIAVYEPGPARPTGGAGVVAMLIGPKAPISFERGVRGSYMEHAYDFYKPNLSSEYPVVDGHLSITCYLRALDSCYNIYSQRFAKQHGGAPFDLSKTDYALFHSPFTKMVRKSYARMKHLDYLQNPESFGDSVPREVLDLTVEQSYTDRASQKIFGDMIKEEYDAKVAPSLLLPKQLGNTYTASLYTGLLSLIAERSDEQLVDKRLLMFSYGSGLAATQWSFKVNSSVEHIRAKSDIKARLAARTEVSPEEYTAALKLREDTHNLASYTPKSTVDHLPKGTYYLENVDDKKRRFYNRV